MEGDIGVLDGLVAKEGDGHLVGTTHTHTIDRVVTVDVSHSGILGAGRHVNRHNGRAGQGLSGVIFDVSGEAGSRDLSEGRDSDKGRHDSGDSFFN